MKGLVGTSMMSLGERGKNNKRDLGSIIKANQLLKIKEKLPTDVVNTLEFVSKNPLFAGHYKKMIFKFWIEAAKKGLFHGVSKLREIKPLINPHEVTNEYVTNSRSLAEISQPDLH